MKDNIIRYKNLSWPLKTAVIVSWILGVIYAFWFLFGVALGIMTELGYLV